MYLSKLFIKIAHHNKKVKRFFRNISLARKKIAFEIIKNECYIKPSKQTAGESV